MQHIFCKEKAITHWIQKSRHIICYIFGLDKWCHVVNNDCIHIFLIEHHENCDIWDYKIFRAKQNIEFVTTLA